MENTAHIAQCPRGEFAWADGLWDTTLMSNETLARVLDGADPAVRMQDDLFRAVNGTWIRDKEIPADLASYGSFVKLRLESEANVRAIIEDLASGE